MYEPHIADLVAQVNSGAPVRVIRQPYKVGWHYDALYLEAHPRPVPVKNGEGEPVEQSVSHSGFVAQIIKATAERTAVIDWPLAFATAQEAQGLPVKISR